MPDNETQSGHKDREIESTVQAFGNGAHVVVPKKLVGETVTVSVQSEVDRYLSPPVSIEDIHSVFQLIEIDDFHAVNTETPPEGSTDYRFAEESGHESPAEGAGQFVFSDDTRLRIEIGIRREVESRYYQVEVGTALFVHEADPSVMRPYVDDSLFESIDDPTGDILWRVDELEGVLEGSDDTIAHHAHNCGIYWDGDLIDEFEFTYRRTEVGNILVPYFSDIDDIEDYIGSFKYTVASLLSSVPTDVYDTYFDVLGDQYTADYEDRTTVRVAEGKLADPDRHELISLEELAEKASVIRFYGESVNK